MLAKLGRALAVWVAATRGTVLVLRKLEDKGAGMARPPSRRIPPRKSLVPGEVDADSLDEQERAALLRELEGQL